MKNIVLIGMPGSGKSSVGKVLAHRLGAELADTDAMIQRRDGRPIPEIFSQSGEDFFRDLESLVAREAAGRGGAVISTGGGMVLRRENMDALKAGGVIFFLDRPPEALAGLDHQGRPLMAGGADRVFELYRQRIGLYRGCADHIIENPHSAEQAAEEIMERMEQEGLA